MTLEKKLPIEITEVPKEAKLIKTLEVKYSLLNGYYFGASEKIRREAIYRAAPKGSRFFKIIKPDPTKPRELGQGAERLSFVKTVSYYK